jgi:hypothetical protein
MPRKGALERERPYGGPVRELRLGREVATSASDS